MKDVIWLRCDSFGVRGFTKSLPTLKRGEFPIKIKIEVDDKAVVPPILEQSIHITDWRDGVNFPDVGLKEMAITKEEATKIRKMREEAMRKDLEALGYTITAPPPAGAKS